MGETFLRLSQNLATESRKWHLGRMCRSQSSMYKLLCRIRCLSHLTSGSEAKPSSWKWNNKTNTWTFERYLILLIISRNEAYLHFSTFNFSARISLFHTYIFQFSNLQNCISFFSFSFHWLKPSITFRFSVIFRGWSKEHLNTTFEPQFLFWGSNSNQNSRVYRNQRYSESGLAFARLHARYDMREKNWPSGKRSQNISPLFVASTFLNLFT